MSKYRKSIVMTWILIMRDLRDWKEAGWIGFARSNGVPQGELNELKRADSGNAANAQTIPCYKILLAYLTALHATAPAQGPAANKEKDEHSDVDNGEEVEQDGVITEKKEDETAHATCSEETCGDCGISIEKLGHVN
jgi:hypothetical protein